MRHAPPYGATARVLASFEGAVRVVAAIFRFLLAVRRLCVSRALAVLPLCSGSLSFVFSVCVIVMALCHLFSINAALNVCGYSSCCSCYPP
jgi:hypothetical protein